MAAEGAEQGRDGNIVPTSVTVTSEMKVSEQSCHCPQVSVSSCLRGWQQRDPEVSPQLEEGAGAFPVLPPQVFPPAGTRNLFLLLI